MSVYRSNLTPPAGILERFKHIHRRVEPWSYNHDVVSDFADKGDDPRFRNHRNCTMLTEDESAILWNAALRVRPGVWLDIGAHTGLTGTVAAFAGHRVKSIDPEFGWRPFAERFAENVDPELRLSGRISMYAHTSKQFFNGLEAFEPIAGAMIDGNHDAPCPLEDAMNCAMYAAETCALVFHDVYGSPIQDALRWLFENDWSICFYITPNGMAIAHRGHFKPPVHDADPNIPVNRMYLAVERVTGAKK